MRLSLKMTIKKSMKNCIFCKIASGEFDSAKFWEDEEFMAMLDINPNTPGMTLVIPKKHYDSDAVEMPEKEYSKFMLAGKKVAKMLKISLDANRIAIVMEGIGVNHAHLKLYPLHGVGSDFKVMDLSERVLIEKYRGYLTTQLGPQMDLAELKKQAEEIIKNNS
jgi:histidine triad (HIT) family protein